ncbi:MAG: acetyl-CoA carboxylase biotin carboxyl carrier protein [Calditrichaeota bacterium]|nr:MAG: acetyl-CoA carboxylase biotin carboxyl carrier protein [Calditrichota bacterium]
MDVKLIEKLINIVDKSGVNEIEVEEKELKIRITKKPEQIISESTSPQFFQMPIPQGQQNFQQPVASMPSQTTNEQTAIEKPVETKVKPSNLIDITAPMVGTFYESPSPDAGPYVKVGDKISKGQVLCIIEAMKLMNEIESEISGTLVEINAKNAQPVEYGFVMFKVEPDA